MRIDYEMKEAIPMLDKLKVIFPSLKEAHTIQPLDSENYNWYITEESKIVGIPQDDLTDKERMLLETFLNPYHTNQQSITKREEQWIDVLFNHGDPDKLFEKSQASFRFVYFTLSDDTVDPSEFREAIHGLFPNYVPIIWENNQQGVIIEEATMLEDEIISYDEIIDVLMSDFYMKVHLFLSPHFEKTGVIPHYYQWLKYSFDTVLSYENKPVIHYTSSVPYLLLEPLTEENINTIIETILQETIAEEELIKTIQIFLECNSNATLAAKKLYMHRNSLQYRVDKFIEKTGIDVKQFEGALAVYLTLLLKRKKIKTM